MNSIKTYVEGKSLKVFFIISYQGKRFQVYTGITSTVKFSGMVFPKSVPNARAKTAMLARLFASVEEYVYMNGELPVARMKDEIKAIINGRAASVEKNILYYIDEFIKTKAKDSTKEIFLRTRKRIESFDEHADFDNIDRDWLETGAGDKYVGEPLNGKETMQSVLGVPFYDVEFALGYDEMYNDTPNVPTKFISIPGYEKADFWCRASGDSMKPIISNGDIIALKAVDDWQSFLPMNEVYAIMTTNDLRTVKIVRKGSDDAHFTLHAYNEEFEDQEIPKEAIIKVFKVLGSLEAI